MRKKKSERTCRFPIDFFEFSFLVEACIPPVPIARGSFWYDVINIHYHALTTNERARLFEWIGRSGRFDLKNKECALFAARYNPENQFLVTTVHGGEMENRECFKWEGRFHVSQTMSIQEEFIVKSLPITSPTNKQI